MLLRITGINCVEVAEHDVHWARREVVRHCIFGVDLNPMAVELAKLSLWLETVAANKPLTFLDHHLKVGNSLIGAKVEDLKSLPSREKKEAAENGKKQLKAPTLWDFTVKKHFEELLAKYGEFAAHPDDDLKSVKQKEQEYDALQKSEINRRLHELANVWVSTYFGAAPPPDEYAEIQNEMNPKDFPDWSRWRGRDWFRRAQEIAGEKRFFHWELEFPESFYEKGAPKENPGWDAVVGNPPYVSQEQLGVDKEYFMLNYEVYHGVADFEKGKIIYPDLCQTPRFTIDRDGFFVEATLFEIPKDELYLLAILNSSICEFFVRAKTPVFQGSTFRFKTVYLKNLPIRRISFTTPPDRRAALVEQAKALYSEFLDAPGAEDLDRINRIDRINSTTNPVNPVNPVQTVASLSAAPDSLKILEFVGARLSAAPEESDVVHDLLAHLAERMIEMNKNKNMEIKGFLRWLEGEIGAPVEELTNKTAIKEYYEAGFDALAGALAKNKKNLKEGYDPTRREPKEKLQTEFNTSVGKLAPLLKRIDMTDKLIDQIVYKLYGLTSEEIKIVEESISGGKYAKETEIAG